MRKTYDTVVFTRPVPIPQRQAWATRSFFEGGEGKYESGALTWITDDMTTPHHAIWEVQKRTNMPMDYSIAGKKKLLF
jgi:hypothetical protein